MNRKAMKRVNSCQAKRGIYTDFEGPLSGRSIVARPLLLSVLVDGVHSQVVLRDSLLTKRPVLSVP